MTRSLPTSNEIDAKGRARRSLCILALAATLLVGGLARAQEPSLIRIGFANIGVDNRHYSGGSAVAVVHAQGLLEREFAGTGIRIEWDFFKGAGPAVNEALADGQLDFATQGDLPSIVGRAGGLKTRLLAANGIGANTYLAVPTGSPIRSIADLKGKTVADFRGTNGQLAIAKILDGAGLTERDLRTVNLDTAGLKAALAADRVDAGFGGYDLVELRDQGLIDIRYDTRGKSPLLGRQASFLVTDQFAERYPATVDRVVRVVVAAAHWASDERNRNALFDLWSKNGVPARYYAEDFSGDELARRNSPLLDDFFVGRYRAAATLAKRYDLVRTDVDVDAWFDRKPLADALIALGLEDYWTPRDAGGQPAKTQ